MFYFLNVEMKVLFSLMYTIIYSFAGVVRKIQSRLKQTALQ